MKRRCWEEYDASEDGPEKRPRGVVLVSNKDPVTLEDTTGATCVYMSASAQEAFPIFPLSFLQMDAMATREMRPLLNPHTMATVSHEERRALRAQALELSKGKRLEPLPIDPFSVPEDTSKAAQKSRLQDLSASVDYAFRLHSIYLKGSPVYRLRTTLLVLLCNRLKTYLWTPNSRATRGPMRATALLTAPTPSWPMGELGYPRSPVHRRPFGSEGSSRTRESGAVRFAQHGSSGGVGRLVRSGPRDS